MPYCRFAIHANLAQSNDNQKCGNILLLFALFCQANDMICQRMNAVAHVNSGKTIRHIAHTHSFFVLLHSYIVENHSKRIIGLTKQWVEEEKTAFQTKCEYKWAKMKHISQHSKWSIYYYGIFIDRYEHMPNEYLRVAKCFQKCTTAPKKKTQNKTKHTQKERHSKECIVGASVRYLSLSPFFLGVCVSEIQCSNIHRQMRIILRDCKVSWLMLFSVSEFFLSRFVLMCMLLYFFLSFYFYVFVRSNLNSNSTK